MCVNTDMFEKKENKCAAPADIIINSFSVAVSYTRLA